MPIAVIAFDFDPLLRLGDDLVVRWQTVALAALIAACLVVAGVLARRASLRPDDLLYIVVGACQEPSSGDDWASWRPSQRPSPPVR